MPWTCVGSLTRAETPFVANVDRLAHNRGDNLTPDVLEKPMKTITKHFKTLKAAETYQNRLYNKYESVELVRWPRFGEGDGYYSWRVSGATS